MRRGDIFRLYRNSNARKCLAKMDTIKRAIYTITVCNSEGYK